MLVHPRFDLFLDFKWLKKIIHVWFHFKYVSTDLLSCFLGRFLWIQGIENTIENGIQNWRNEDVRIYQDRKDWGR